MKATGHGGRHANTSALQVSSFTSPDSSTSLGRFGGLAQIAATNGWEPGGIQKGSNAAKFAKAERAYNGGSLPKMTEGGVSASFQSIGATGRIKPAAEASLMSAMIRGATLRIADANTSSKSLMQNDYIDVEYDAWDDDYDNDD
ncbi:hypothetical protein CYMTET_13179 [Cymbomonas tetramitiformis]|uniref:Uncharacterized protein n=1 Tax=Cymbomonas tetramitiformis TaxID=36881 RepID=A0AAE0LBQ7_9CHLO|nr:hypothetical protein CYMTET_13179 [Cymbomonas tetramitiformis]